MFNKTIRSALSLLLVFCLLLGMSGNAIAMAIGDSASRAVDKIDKEVETIIADLRDTIANLDAKVKEQETTLNNGEAELTKAEAKLDAAEIELEEAEANLLIYGGTPEMLAKVEEALAKVHAAQAEVAEAQKLVEEAEKTLALAESTIADAYKAIDNVEKTYEDLRAALADPHVSVAYVEETVKELRNNVDALWQSILDLETSVDELIEAYAALENAETDAVDVPEMPKELTELAELLDKAIAIAVTLNEALDYFVAAAEKVLEVTEGALRRIYNVLKNNLSRDMHKKVYNWLYNNPDKVCELVKEFGVYGLDLLVKYGPYALDLLNNHFDLTVLAMKVTAGGAYLTATLGAKALGYLGNRFDFLKDYKGKIINAARKMYAYHGDEAKALINVYVDYLQLKDRYYNATHAEIEVLCNSNYVVIGDDTAYTDFTSVTSYADVLAKKLGLTGNVDCLYGETVEDVLANVDGWTATLEQADLITLGFGNLPAINAMLDILGHQETAEIDWSVMANDEVTEMIGNVLAELEADLVDRGYESKTVALAVNAAEAYAYTYALQQHAYIDLINKIQAVNGDALIVIVGAYNELENISVDVYGKNIAIGELIQPMVYAVNLQGLAEGFMNKNVIFVDAPAVETVYEAEGIESTDAWNLLQSLYDMFLPSENGNAYIADQIYKALKNPACAEHVPGTVVIENKVAADCVNPGSYDEVVYCEFCGDELSRDTIDVPELGHDMGEWYVTVEPTVEAEGEERCDCNRCDYFKTRTIDKLTPENPENPENPEDPEHKHTPGAIEIENEVAADCVNPGKYDEVVYCSACGEEMSRVTTHVDALGHDMGEWYVTKPATVEAEGEERCDCNRCDYFKTRTIDKLTPENPENPENPEDPEHKHTAGEPVIENIVPGADCQTQGTYDEVVYCEVCGEELSRVTVNDGVFGSHVPGTPVMEDVFEADCVNPGSYDLVVYCTVCGEKLSYEPYASDALGHKYGNWTLHKLPTFSEDGELRRYCSRCGEYESLMIPDLSMPNFDFDFDLDFDFDFDFDFSDATHADYTIFHDSLYVAIGDSTAVSDSYVDKLAELLEIPHMTENLAQMDMTIAEAIDLVGEESKLISKADLITLGFSNIAASRDMLNALNGNYTADWSAAVGQDAAALIDSALAALKTQMVADGLDEETVKMALDAANAYAYAYAARCMLYPELVKTIREVNADALIVIVGTYNDLEDVVVDVNGRKINVGKYTEYLINVANLENLMQAVHCDNVIYVGASDVETELEAENLGQMNNLGYLMSILGDKMLPSDAGHAYIAQRIYDALNVRYAIWGDVNGDRKVTTCDARLILMYIVGKIDETGLDLEWADVNGDGKVSTADARWILMLVVDYVEHFPVCNFSKK